MYQKTLNTKTLMKVQVKFAEYYLERIEYDNKVTFRVTKINNDNTEFNLGEGGLKRMLKVMLASIDDKPIVDAF